MKMDFFKKFKKKKKKEIQQAEVVVYQPVIQSCATVRYAYQYYFIGMWIYKI